MLMLPFSLFSDMLNGYFTLTNLPLGRVDIDSSHLTFNVTIDSPRQSIDLGKIKYPLFHPPHYYGLQAAPLVDFSQLLYEGASVEFEVCAEDTSWMRPASEIQRKQVYSQPPFDQYNEKSFGKFDQIAVLYDTGEYRIRCR